MAASTEELIKFLWGGMVGGGVLQVDYEQG
jgi:hypothetical protein